MGASALIKLNYIGNGPTGSGQIIADQTSAPKGKTLYGYGTLVSGSDATTAAVGFVDGVASLGRTIVIPINKVDASDGTNSVYYSVGADSAFSNGDLVTVLGCSVSANNVTNAVVSKVSSDRFSAINASGTAETGLTQASAKVNRGGTPAWVNVFYAAASTDSSTAAGVFATGAGHFQATAITATGFTLNYPTVTTSAVTVNFGCVIAFSS